MSLQRDLEKYYSKLDEEEDKHEQSRLKAIDFINEKSDDLVFELKLNVRNRFPRLSRKEVDELVKEILPEYI